MNEFIMESIILRDRHRKNEHNKIKIGVREMTPISRGTVIRN